MKKGPTLLRLTPNSQPVLPCKQKYRAKPTTIDGRRFHSLKEAKYYLYLRSQLRDGKIKELICQFKFDLPGKVKYYADFLVKHINDSEEYIDVKGFDTPISKLKRKQVKELYGIEVKIV